MAAPSPFAVQSAAVREALRLKFEAQEAALERERQQRAKQLEAERQAEREREFLRQQRQQVERQLGVMGKFGLLAAYVEALKRNRRLTDEDPWEGGDFPVYQRNFIDSARGLGRTAICSGCC